MAIRDPELQGSLRGVHVLLIDDDAESLDQIKRVLEYCGALVTVRTFARQALGVLQAVRPTVLVIGIGTPAETAYAFIRSVRASSAEHGGTVPAVALTPLGYGVAPERIIAQGFQAHVAKPVHGGELSATITHVVTESSERNAAR